MARPPVEPYMIRSVMPVRLLPREERLRRLEEAWWNVFRLRSEDVFIDLLTDSGTGAMSVYQWAALMAGDEAYAGSRSWERFQSTVRALFGMEYVLPVHQGRAGERILYTTLMRLRRARVVPANTHFDTGRAVVLNAGGEPMDLPVPGAWDRRNRAPFKGDMDVAALEALVRERGPESIAFILLVLTNNTVGGHPVSLDNVRAVREVAERHGIPLVMDVSRIAENSYLVKERDPRYSSWSVAEILRETVRHADHIVMSAKKDGLANIGGFIATRDLQLYEELAARVVLEEGYVTYGGLAGRDLDAIAQGLRESIDEDYLRHRVGQVRYLGELLAERGVPVVEPVGGHAVYVDALEALPHIPRDEFPADALAASLYLESGVRAVGLGALAFARARPDGETEYPPFEYLRLAVPRRTYTNTQLEYTADALAGLIERPERIPGLQIEWQPRTPGVRHFLAKLKPARRPQA